MTVPVPDLYHGPSQLSQMSKRVAANMPVINNARLRSFKRFVKRFVKTHMQHLIFDETETFDFDEWLDNTPYEAFRKDELREVKRSLEYRPSDNKIKAFIKDETYPEYKHLRGIYSRSDDYKVLVGPFFQKFGDRLFESPYFIKKIPVHMRPEKIEEKLRRFDNIFCTDFSCYEATFVSKLMAIEHWVYNFALQKHGKKKYFNDLIARMRDVNIIDFKNFTVKLKGKRMSGEMNTSCGNGLMNFLITMYVLEQSGNNLDKDVDGYFEGDDGINGCKILPTAQIYVELGCNIKIEVPSDLSTASFCGNVFVPGINHNVTNPMEASVRFGWTTAKYRFANDNSMKNLILAKSISLLYEYPGCPILKSLAHYGLRVSSFEKKKRELRNIVGSYANHSSNTYYKSKMLSAVEQIEKFGLPDEEIHIETRMLVEKLYSISVGQQLLVESYLDSLCELRPLELDLPFPRLWFSNDVEYTLWSAKDHDLPFEKKGFSTAAWLNDNTLRIFHH